MTEIKASQVKDLRTMTGAGMMDCKNALTEADGDMDLANDILRKKGMKLVDKKAGRDANEGLVGVHIRQEDDGTLCGCIVEVNCETDFVAKNEMFQKFVADWARRSTMAATINEEELANLISKVGENIKLGSSAMIKGGPVMSSYVHNKVAGDLGSIGVLIVLDGEPSEELASTGYEIAMHIAASKPKAVAVENLDPEWVENERRLLTEQALESGKPENIVGKMVEGRMNKVLRAVTLLDQPFVINPDKTVGKVLEEAGATVIGFVRLEVGE